MFRQGILRWLALGTAAFVLMWVGMRAPGFSGQAASPPLVVAAASDLQFAFTELGLLFEEQFGQEVIFSFDSTGNLAHQIASGAPVDVFAAADVAYLDRLQAQGLVVPGSRQTYAYGRLVLAVNDAGRARAVRLEDLLQLEVRHVALANPAHAPFGSAAKQALEAAGLWDALQPKLVYGESVRQAMQFVQRGSADAGLIALSVAGVSGISHTPVDTGLYDPLQQAMAAIAGSPREVDARRFIALVTGPRGRRVLQRYGFSLPDQVDIERGSVLLANQVSAARSLAAELSPLYLSLKVAGLATALCFAVGLGVAWLLARRRFVGRELLSAISTLPQVLPPSVLGYYLLVVMGSRSGFGQMLERALGLRLVFSWEGAVVAAALLAFPLMVQSIRIALEGVDIGMEEVARTLGRSEWDVFRTITVPLAWRGIVAGIVLTFTRALGEFGATLMLAGNIPGRTQTLSLAVYDAVQAGDSGRAMLFVAMTTALSGALLLISRQFGWQARG